MIFLDAPFNHQQNLQKVNVGSHYLLKWSFQKGTFASASGALLSMTNIVHERGFCTIFLFLSLLVM